MIILLPEIWFDIFKLLNYNQLCNLRLTKRLFLLLIDHNKNNFALKEFHSLEFDREGHDYMSSWLKAKDIYKEIVNKYGYKFDLFEPNDNLIKKWNAALTERIPLFIPEMYTKLKSAEYNIIITIKEKDPYNQRLRLFLPHFPERIGQLIFIRYWLEQLSFCSFFTSFCYCDCYYAIFNPKILNLIFDDFKSFNFYTKIAGLDIAKNNNLELNKQFIEFVSKHLIITKCLYLCIGNNQQQNNNNNYYENIIKLILNYGNKIAKIRFCYENIIFEHSLLINTIIENIQTSINCSKIISDIEIKGINNLPLPNLLLNIIKSEKGLNKEKHFYTKYLIVNNNYYFIIYFSHPTDSKKYKYFHFYRTNFI